MGKPGFWRPSSEEEATGNMAVFVEWLRATGRRPATSPEDVRSWWAAQPEALLEAVAGFAPRETADRAMLSALAEHLLVADTRPGDALIWRGDPKAAWPRAARAIGAKVVVVRPEGPDPDAPAVLPPSSP